MSESEPIPECGVRQFGDKDKPCARELGHSGEHCPSVRGAREIRSKDAELSQLRGQNRQLSERLDCGKTPCVFVGGLCLRHRIEYDRTKERELEAALRSVTDLLKKRVEESYDIADDPEVMAAVMRANSLLLTAPYK